MELIATRDLGLKLPPVDASGSWWKPMPRSPRARLASGKPRPPRGTGAGELAGEVSFAFTALPAPRWR